MATLEEVDRKIKAIAASITEAKASGAAKTDPANLKKLVVSNRTAARQTCRSRPQNHALLQLSSFPDVLYVCVVIPRAMYRVRGWLCRQLAYIAVQIVRF